MTAYDVYQGNSTLDLPDMDLLQNIALNPDDAVTVLGFEGQQGMFVAAQITNDTTGQTLHLRDPNGRPLWAGRGQGGGGGGQE